MDEDHAAHCPCYYCRGFHAGYEKALKDRQRAPQMCAAHPDRRAVTAVDDTLACAECFTWAEGQRPN